MQNSSKLNAALLIIVIALLGVGIWKLSDKKESEEVKNPTGYTQTNNDANGPDYQPNGNPTPNQGISWVQDQKYGGYFYPKGAEVFDPGVDAFSFSYGDVAITVAGEVNCKPNVVFQYGVSTEGCVKGIAEAAIHPISQRPISALTLEEKNLFGDFVLKNKMTAEKTYQGNGFSFNYDSNAVLKSSIHPEAYNMTLVKLNKGDESVVITYYPDVTISNFDTSRITGSTTVNGKVFSYDDVPVEGGATARTYFYREGNKVVAVFLYPYQVKALLVDLGSIEIK